MVKLRMRKRERREEMGQIIMRNWDLREFHVQVNLSCLIRQVRVRIRHVITPIRGIPNRIRQIVPLISHIRSYPLPCSPLQPISLFLVHNSTIIKEHKVKSSLSISLCHNHQFTPSSAHTEYSIYVRIFVFLSFS